MKKLLFVLMLSGAGLAAAAYKFNGPPPNAVAEERPTVTMEFGPMLEVVSATGVVQPRDVVPVGADQPGRVTAVYADLYRQVQAGEVLCQLDDRLAKLKLNQAKLGVELAQADVARAEAARDAAAVAATRAKEMFGFGGQQRDVDAAVAAARAAEVAVAATQVRVREAEAGRLLAEFAVDLSVVRAPVGGVIIEKRVTAGQQAGPPLQAHLFTIAPDLMKMQVIAQVAEGDIGKVRTGQPAVATVNAYPDGPTFTGTLGRVQPVPTSVSGAVYYAAPIDVVNTKDPATGDWRLRPGMPTGVDVTVRKHDNVWKLPAAAVGVTFDETKLSDAARLRLSKGRARPDRANWLLAWTPDADKNPWPIFLRVGGVNAAGEAGLTDNNCREVLAWDPEEPAPSPAKPPLLMVAPPAGKEKPALKLF